MDWPPPPCSAFWMDDPWMDEPCRDEPCSDDPCGVKPPPLASFFGFRSRTLRFFFFDFAILVFLFWVVCCLYCVSDAEQQLPPARDGLFWNQIIKADQFFLVTLWPMTCWFSRTRIFFVFRCTHFERLLPAFMPPPPAWLQR